MDAPANTASPPVDWEKISEEILCPLCDYNLRGLIEPRCPECGSRYEWPDLLDPRRRRHPFLFEHHPEQNWRSFWRTLRAGLKPRKFWRSLHPVQPSSPKRLIAYVAGVLFATLLIYPVASFLEQMVALIQVGYRWGGGISFSPGIVSAAWDNLVTDPFRRESALSMFVLGWPVTTFIILMIFRASMRRARIKAIHIVRCVVYTSDILFWFAGATVGYKVLEILYSLQLFTVYNDIDNMLLLIWLVSIVINQFSSRSAENARTKWPAKGFRLLTKIVLWTGLLAMFNVLEYGSPVSFGFASMPPPFLVVLFYCIAVRRLIVAYRLYLQFDRPVATILASQVILLLVFSNIYFPLVLW